MTEAVVDYLLKAPINQRVELIDHGQRVFGKYLGTKEGIVRIKVSRYCEAYSKELRVWATALADLAGEEFQLNK